MGRWSIWSIFIINCHVLYGRLAAAEHLLILIDILWIFFDFFLIELLYEGCVFFNHKNGGFFTVAGFLHELCPPRPLHFMLAEVMPPPLPVIAIPPRRSRF